MIKVEYNCETGETTEIELTQAEIAQLEQDQLNAAWRNLRDKRDALLLQSDWTVLSDTPTSTAAWKTYRQALRDLPGNTTDPFNPVWPTPPA